MALVVEVTGGGGDWCGGGDVGGGVGGCRDWCGGGDGGDWCGGKDGGGGDS